MSIDDTIKAKAISIAQQAGQDPISCEYIAKLAYGREVSDNEVLYVTEVLRANNLPYLLETKAPFLDDFYTEDEREVWEPQVKKAVDKIIDIVIDQVGQTEYYDAVVELEDLLHRKLTFKPSPMYINVLESFQDSRYLSNPIQDVTGVLKVYKRKLSNHEVTTDQEMTDIENHLAFFEEHMADYGLGGYTRVDDMISDVQDLIYDPNLKGNS